jgi:hypothetical protein
MRDINGVSPEELEIAPEPTLVVPRGGTSQGSRR